MFGIGKNGLRGGLRRIDSIYLALFNAGVKFLGWNNLTDFEISRARLLTKTLKAYSSRR